MVSLYRFFKSHKWLMYLCLGATTILFAFFAFKCRFEENIAKLLPPTGDNMTVDLAFSELKVKDKVFVQVLRKDTSCSSLSDREMLTEALDYFMQTLEQDDKIEGLIEGTLYEIDPAEYIDVAYYLAEQSPAYLDFTDNQMDSLLSIEHLTYQIGQYKNFIENNAEAGELLYDFIAYDPAGILLSKLPINNAQNSRFYNNHLFSADSKVCQGFVSPNLNSMDSGQAGKLLKAIKRAKKLTEEQFSDVEILYHGTVIQSANNAARIKTDLLYTIGIALIIILLLLGWCFKQPSTNVLILMPILYGAIFALFGMYVCKGSMSVMALGIGAIVLGVALSYCLHVMIHFKYVGEAERTIKEQTKPVILGSLTTIGAFAGLLFTQSSLLQDFGLFAVFAMIGTTVASLIFMPHFFPKINKKNQRAFDFLEKINNAEIDKKTWLLVLMLVFVVATCAFSPFVKFDSDLKHINYTAEDVLRSRQIWQQKNNKGMFQQYYASVAADMDDALVGLEALENKCDSLKKQGVIHSFSKVSTFMPSLSTQQQRINHWHDYFDKNSAATWSNIQKACRQNQIEAEWFLPFKELMSANIQPQLLSDINLIPEMILSNLTEQVEDKYLVFLPVKLSEQDVNKVNGILTSIRPTEKSACLVLDPFYYTIDTVKMMNDDFNTILGISALFVLVVLLLSFRRLTVAIIAFLPMTISWYVVLGAMYLTGHEFNLINIVVSSFIFGIGVDYSIFIMDGLLARERGDNPQLLTYHKTAITISATILVICMFSLLFAQHPAIRSIGFASLVGMITTMMLSYTLEPWLFRLCMKSKWIRRKVIGNKK